MKQFLLSLFSDNNGSASSKRMVLFMLVIVFLITCLVNLFAGKELQADLRVDLVTLILTAFGFVFGEKVTDIFTKKSDQPNTPTP